MIRGPQLHAERLKRCVAAKARPGTGHNFVTAKVFHSGSRTHQIFLCHQQRPWPCMFAIVLLFFYACFIFSCSGMAEEGCKRACTWKRALSVEKGRSFGHLPSLSNRARLSAKPSPRPRTLDYTPRLPLAPNDLPAKAHRSK